MAAVSVSNRNVKSSSILSSKRGFSVIEAMVTVGLIAIISVGTLSIQKMNLEIQRQNQVITTAQLLCNRFENLLRDKTSWERTLAGNPAAFACLLVAPPAPKDCQALIGLETPFTVFDNAGAFYQSLSVGGATATYPDPLTYPPVAEVDGNEQGFTEGGQPCNTHQQASGSSCAFGFYVTWTPNCTAAPCVNPSISIKVVMHYKPAQGAPPVSEAKYSIANPPYVRTASAQDFSFMLVHKVNGKTGGGACVPGTNVLRPLTLIEDTNQTLSNPAAVGNTDTSFTIQKAGTYRCTGTAAGFAVDGFKALLREGAALGGTIVATGTGFAPRWPQWLQSHANFDTILTMTAAEVPKTFHLEQSCSNDISTSPTAATDEVGVANYALGMPALPYGPPEENIFASITCILVDQTM